MACDASQAEVNEDHESFHGCSPDSDSYRGSYFQ